MKYLRPAIAALLVLAVLVVLFVAGETAPAYAATFTVTKSADTNDGFCDFDCSLREAIGAANALAGADIITFDPTVFPPATPATISLGSSLPTLSGGGDTVDGSAAGVVVDGNTFTCFQITSSGNVIKGLQITGCLGAVVIFGGAQNNTIGGAVAGEGNVISGNGGDGAVQIAGTGTNFNAVIGNLIGTAALGNGVGGVFIFNGAQNNTIGGADPGEGNVIDSNAADGVRVHGAGTTGNTIRGNSISSNGRKGIENILGGNTELAPPVILAVGSAAGTACADCTVDVYSDDADEGRVYHGSTTADGTGNWSFPGAVIGPNATATATDASGNTSEFSQPFAVPSVNIDIKPRSINSNNRGLIPVAILSTPDFDAPTEVDRDSLTFGPTGDEESLAFCPRNAKDVDGAGLRDLVCHFHTEDTGFQCGDTEGVLRGETLDGVPIEDTDSVRIVPCR